MEYYEQPIKGGIGNRGVFISKMIFHMFCKLNPIVQCWHWLTLCGSIAYLRRLPLDGSTLCVYLTLVVVCSTHFKLWHFLQQLMTDVYFILFGLLHTTSTVILWNFLWNIQETGEILLWKSLQNVKSMLFWDAGVAGVQGTGTCKNISIRLCYWSNTGMTRGESTEDCISYDYPVCLLEINSIKMQGSPVKIEVQEILPPPENENGSLPRDPIIKSRSGMGRRTVLRKHGIGSVPQRISRLFCRPRKSAATHKLCTRIFEKYSNEIFSVI